MKAQLFVSNHKRIFVVFFIILFGIFCFYLVVDSVQTDRKCGRWVGGYCSYVVCHINYVVKGDESET